MRDVLLPGVMHDQETSKPDQEDGRGGQEVAMTSTMPEPSRGEKLSAVGTCEDDLPDPRSLDRSQEGQETHGKDYVGTSQEDRSQEKDTAGPSPGLTSGREYHVIETEEDGLQDSNGLDMRGNQEEDASASLNTTETRQDKSQEGSGSGMNVATPVPSISLAVHQAARMTERHGVALLDTRRSFMSSILEEDTLTVSDITSSCQEDCVGGSGGSMKDTEVEPSIDSRIHHCSSATGKQTCTHFSNDTLSGTSEDTPPSPVPNTSDEDRTRVEGGSEDGPDPVRSDMNGEDRVSQKEGSRNCRYS